MKRLISLMALFTFVSVNATIQIGIKPLPKDFDHEVTFNIKNETGIDHKGLIIDFLSYKIEFPSDGEVKTKKAAFNIRCKTPACYRSTSKYTEIEPNATYRLRNYFGRYFFITKK